MGIIGLNITKIAAERKSPAAGKIDINNNASIKEIDTAEFNFGKAKQAGLRFAFVYTSSYSPNIANIELSGEVLYQDDVKKCQDVLKAWKKKERLPQEILTDILNAIVSRCNIEALILSKELNIPPPLQMPRITASTPQETKDY